MQQGNIFLFFLYILHDNFLSKWVEYVKCESESLMGISNQYIAVNFGMHAAKHVLLCGVAPVVISLILFS